MKGKPLQRKGKPPKKQEEKERKGKGKPQEDELKGSLADDDSSSSTTETSIPDTEPLLKEVGGQVCRRHSRPGLLAQRGCFIIKLVRTCARRA